MSELGLAGFEDQQDLKISRINGLERFEKMTLDELTYKINGCVMKVHNTLGNGFQEVIYQRCLAIELERVGLEFEREKEHDIFYDGIRVGMRRADFVVEYPKNSQTATVIVLPRWKH